MKVVNPNGPRTTSELRELATVIAMREDSNWGPEFAREVLRLLDENAAARERAWECFRQGVGNRVGCWPKREEFDALWNKPAPALT